MPTISQFYGLIVRMYPRGREHEPPHIHVFYGGAACSINLLNCACEHGKIPARALGMAVEWTRKHQAALLEMWETGEITKLPPLE